MTGGSVPARGLRLAAVGDAAAIARVEAIAAHQPWSEASIRRTLGSPTAIGWVIGEPVAGHLLASCLAEEGEILTLAVEPAARGRGFGRALVEACALHWRERGVLAGWLEVRADNAVARGLYARTGWVDAGIRPRYYADGVDAMVMRWSV